MHHRSPLAITLMSLVFLTFACSGDGDGDAPADSATTAGAGGTRFLSIGTAPPGGAFFVVGGALGEVLDSHGPAGWSVTAEATKGSQENIRRLAAGELDMALANAAISYFAVRGSEGWEQAYPVRTIMTLAPNVALFLTPADSGVQTLADLRGKRVVVGPAGAGFNYFLRPVLAAHGLTYDDFTPVHNTQAAAVDMLADGSAAAAFLGGAIPTASITQATASRDTLFIPFAPEAVTKLTTDYPFFDTATIPAGTYRGQEKDFAGLNLGSMHLITFEAVDEGLVYQITRTIYENREKVVEKHRAGRAINPKIVVRDTGTPFHPGAIRYYREIGIWPEPEPGS
ncbi:MAG: TAXI family TRAP transporter solute-binding subunit [Acidobacteria bacterium]|nr:TAXI family TRAP transporter solute-binding subunit [Acidobacteriota bacterium]